MPSILLIDDDASQLEELRNEVASRLEGQADQLLTWVPAAEDDASIEFQRLISERPVIVVTDSNLSKSGQPGLFGATIVSWCQERAIPVIQYSRDPKQLPRFPDLFELHIARGVERGRFIAGAFHGFVAIVNALTNDGGLLTLRSPAAIVAQILGVPELENELSLYTVRLGPTNGALMALVTEDARGLSKRQILSFIAGHLLMNAVLRFPGPILPFGALCGYVGLGDERGDDFHGLMSKAKYNGPFKDLEDYYWTHEVDAILDPLFPADVEAETVGELRRMGIERSIGHALAKHGCQRCEGVNGGYYCPLTDRAVCLRADCSVGSNSWIPQGARVCRIERDYFSEWSPILGL